MLAACCLPFIVCISSVLFMGVNKCMSEARTICHRKLMIQSTTVLQISLKNIYEPNPTQPNPTSWLPRWRITTPPSHPISFRPPQPPKTGNNKHQASHSFPHLHNTIPKLVYSMEFPRATHACRHLSRVDVLLRHRYSSRLVFWSAGARSYNSNPRIDVLMWHWPPKGNLYWI